MFFAALHLVIKISIAQSNILNNSSCWSDSWLGLVLKESLHHCTKDPSNQSKVKKKKKKTWKNLHTLRRVFCDQEKPRDMLLIQHCRYDWINFCCSFSLQSFSVWGSDLLCSLCFQWYYSSKYLVLLWPIWFSYPLFFCHFFTI